MPRKTKTVRRSVALPTGLVETVSSLAPPELRRNWNRLVIVSLQEYAARQLAKAFEDDMAEMARDPAIRRVSRNITREFDAALADGLMDD